MTTIHATGALSAKKTIRTGLRAGNKTDAPSPAGAITRLHVRLDPAKEAEETQRYYLITVGSKLAAHRTFHEMVEIERNGVPAQVFAGNIERLKMPSSRALQIFNIPKSTAAHKLKTDGKFEGADALAYIRLEKLLLLAESIVANSLHPDANNFDSGKWLGEWIERPQPALGGLKPADLLDTEAGGLRVQQVLAAIESGAYQ